MNKKVTLLLYMLLGLLLISSCEKRAEQVAIYIHPVPSSTFYSYEEMYEYLIEAKFYNKNELLRVELDDEKREQMDIAANNWNIGQLQEYYIPAWVPESFALRNSGFNDVNVWFYYDHKDYDPQKSNRTYDMNNMIAFYWRRHRVEAKDTFEYHDYGVSEYTKPLKRSYNWIENGYRFTLSIPLCVIEAIESGEMALDLNTDLTFENAKSVEFSDITQLMEGDINFDNLVKNLVIKVILEE